MAFKDPVKAKEYKAKYYKENKTVLSEKRKKYQEVNKEKISARHKVRYNKILEDRPEYLMFLAARKRAREKSLPIDIEEKDIDVPEYCPILGIKLERGLGCIHSASPSLDKINPSRGYIKENIQVVSHKANVMKNDATPEELRMFARWVLKTFPEESDGKT